MILTSVCLLGHKHVVCSKFQAKQSTSSREMKIANSGELGVVLGFLKGFDIFFCLRFDFQVVLR